MMRKISVLILLSSCFIANAQMGMDPQEMMRKAMTSTGRLMSQNDFKKELKLSGDQNKKVSDLAKSHEKKSQELLRKSQKSGADMSAMTVVMAEMEVLETETDKAIQAELNPDQLRRLAQIKWQIAGVKAIYDPILQKELGLSEDQVAKLETWKEGSSERMMGLMEAGGNANKIKEARKKMKADDEANTIGILTPEQVTKYKAALGSECKAAKRMSELLF